MESPGVDMSFWNTRMGFLTMVAFSILLGVIGAMAVKSLFLEG